MKTDSDYAQIVRVKAAKEGWTYHMACFEIETSTLNTLYYKDEAGNNISGVTVKYFDSNGTELVQQADCDSSCVMTRIDFEPAYDFEIIGGLAKILTDPANDVRIWVVAVPDISAQNGGSKVMINGANFKFIKTTDKVEADGRATKYMVYNATYHTNKLRFTVKHTAGEKHKMYLVIEMFRT